MECWSWKYGGVISGVLGMEKGIGVGGRCQLPSVFIVTQLRRADRGTEKVCRKNGEGLARDKHQKKVK